MCSTKSDEKKLREAGISIGRTSFLFYFFFEGEYKKKKGERFETEEFSVFDA